MTGAIAAAVMGELRSRGYATDGTAPNDTMDLNEDYMRSVELGDLLDLLVSRREKIFRSVDVVGRDIANKSYDDVVIAVDAVKSVIARVSATPLK